MIKSFNLKTTKLIFPKFHFFIFPYSKMPQKKVCKQYPQDQYGPKAPDISGKWDVYISYILTDNGVITKKNLNSLNNITQDKLYFDYGRETTGEKSMGMLYPVGKCWEAKTVDNKDNGTTIYKLTKIKNGKVTRMQSVYTEAGLQPTNPEQFPTVSVVNWYRAD